MEWWIWAVAGVAFVVVEVFTTGFFMVFFGVGALASALVSFLGVLPLVWEQTLVFSIVSVISLALFRKPLMRHFGLDKPVHGRDEIVHEMAVPMEDIAPGKVGKAELRGTVWSARNGGAAVLAKGQRCRVVKVDGLTVWLEPEKL